MKRQRFVARPGFHRGNVAIKRLSSVFYRQQCRTPSVELTWPLMWVDNGNPKCPAERLQCFWP